MQNNISDSTAQKILSAGLELGADFVDIFVEETKRASLTFLDSKVKSTQQGTDFGVGIRAIYGDKALYGFSNSAEEQELLTILQSICCLDKRSPVTQLAPLNFPSANDHSPVKKGLEESAYFEQKIDFARKVDALARRHQAVSQVTVNFIQNQRQISIWDSEGLKMNDQQNYIRVAGTVVASNGHLNVSSFHAPGALNGYAFIENLNVDNFSEEITKSALNMLKAGPCPAGKMPVVIEKGFGGVIFHEACGHLLETTSVEKKASVFHDKLGEQIAHPSVSAVDDGTMPYVWGSINIDDEGMPTQKTQLIKEGVLKQFLCDRVGEIKTGHPRTGSARRQSYKFPPASRMRNTFIESGQHTDEEMIASIQQGIYAKKMGGGSVRPGTGEFNFNVQEGYLIKDGKITKPIRGATLIGTGPEILKKISMVGKDLALSAGMCGSVSGSVPVTVGQPAIKVDEILVGGKA